MLCPLAQDEQLILTLLKDPVPLIRTEAALCAVSIGSIPLLKTIFEDMKKESSRGRYAYRDAILKGQPFIFSWIREQLKIEKDTELRALYLDILSAKFDSSVLLYIKEDLKSENDQLRFEAVKVLAKFPNEEAIAWLVPHLRDSYSLIRAEAVKTLPLVFGVKAISALKYALVDSEWWVRLQAALSLKKLGEPGKKILLEQKKEDNLLAYEVATYVLSLGDLEE